MGTRTGYTRFLFPVEGLSALDGGRAELGRQLETVLKLGYPIGGGAARQLIMGDEAPPANDIDIFMGPGPSPEAIQLAYERLAGWGYQQTGKYNQPGVTTWETGEAGDIPVQLVTIDGNKALRPGESWMDGYALIQTFGLTCEQFALELDPMTDSVLVTYSDLGERNVLDRRIRVNRVVDPLRLVLRFVKYGNKGFRIEPSELSQVFEAYALSQEADRIRWRDANANDSCQFQVQR